MNRAAPGRIRIGGLEPGRRSQRLSIRHRAASLTNPTDPTPQNSMPRGASAARPGYRERYPGGSVTWPPRGVGAVRETRDDRAAPHRGSDLPQRLEHSATRCMRPVGRKRSDATLGGNPSGRRPVPRAPAAQKARRRCAGAWPGVRGRLAMRQNPWRGDLGSGTTASGGGTDAARPGVAGARARVQRTELATTGH